MPSPPSQPSSPPGVADGAIDQAVDLVSHAVLQSVLRGRQHFLQFKAARDNHSPGCGSQDNELWGATAATLPRPRPEELVEHSAELILEDLLQEPAQGE